MDDTITEQGCSKCLKVKPIKAFNRVSQLSEKRESACASCRYKMRIARDKIKSIKFARPPIVLSETAMIINNATRIAHG